MRVKVKVTIEAEANVMTTQGNEIDSIRSILEADTIARVTEMLENDRTKLSISVREVNPE